MRENDNVLSAQEWRDGVAFRYAQVPAGLPKVCDGVGCAKPFDMNHGLNCLRGPNVIRRLMAWGLTL